MSETNGSDDLVMAENRTRADKLRRLAWTIEIVLVSVGLGVALAQATSMPNGSGFVQAFPVFGVFVVLAAVELAKIPAATVVFHARSWARLFALAGLLVASMISFETIFNGFERYVHVTTHPVAEAKNELAEIRGEIAQLADTALENETSGASVAEVDSEQLENLRQALELREEALRRAEQGLKSPELIKLEAELENLLAQQRDAEQAAIDSWQEYMDDQRSRASDPNLSADMRAYAEGLIKGMPRRDTVASEARAKYEPQIAELNERIRSTPNDPSPKSVAAYDEAKTARDLALSRLQDFEKASAEREAARIQTLIAVEDDKRQRAEKIEELEKEAVTAERDLAEVANASQMHRWASFVFGKVPHEVSEDEAKQVGAAFGVLLGLVGALTGSSVAMYGEWFRVRGVQPKIEIREFPVEVVVEKEIEKPVEVEVPVIRYTYVPVPVGEDVDDAVDAILAALPEEAANDLRDQLKHASRNGSGTKEDRYASAA